MSGFSKCKHLRRLASAVPGFTARYLRFKAVQLEFNDKRELDVSHAHCIYCGSEFSPTNSRVRLRPKLGLNKNLKRLLERHNTNPVSIGKYQKNLVRKYLSSKNMLIKTCLQCSKTTKFPAQTRKMHMKRIRSSKPAPEERISEHETIPEDKKLTKKQKKRLKRKQLQNLILGDKDSISLSATSTKEAGMESRNLNESTTVKTKNSTKFVTSNKKKLQQSGKPIPKLMGKNRHQQLSKMLSKEKTENKPASLTMFLSSL
ncbi:UPF0711 protein C18orf21 homolog [Ostrea edulis]|uniref:UPF0711 protein C18orf21 homolog n=1 Tax=Ostrea edulis TaxID=37623 RepID=UPI0024AF5D2D|nr:UPF0711 protein C18orf21 homolog [Ostrea edulis]